MRRVTALLFGVALLPNVSLAESDVLLQAVSFAVTGSDAANVAVIDRKQCVFRVGSETYHFNHIYTDRISFQTMKDKISVWTNVNIHGTTTVVETYSEGMKFMGTEMDYAMMAKNPNFFDRSRTDNSVDYTIRVETNETDRLVRAWQYIFAHGCKGMKSPF
jgi:hypothetical protein